MLINNVFPSPSLQINVVAVEYPGYGKYTKQQASENQIHEDAEAVIKYLLDEVKVIGKNIIVMGRSIGCGPATFLNQKFQLGATVLLSPFTSIRAIVSDIAGKLPSFLIKERFRNDQNIQKSKSAVLIIHGKKDTLIPYQHAIELSRN